METGAPHAVPEQRSSWKSLALLLGTLGLTVALLFIPSDLVERLGNYGYPGVFFLTWLASSTIVLPSPAIGAAALAGKTLDPWLVGLLSGIGASLGEITSYVAGVGGSQFAQRSSLYPRIHAWVERWGFWTIFGLAFIPGPFFVLAGLAAGTLRLPFWRFLGACLIGKVLRFILVAWAGRLLREWGVW